MPLTSRQLSGDQRLDQASRDRNKPLAVPEKGEAVKKLQQALLDLGFRLPKTTAKGGPDGIFGPETLAAVKAFQQRNAVKIDGMAGPDTLGAMDRLLAAPPPAPESDRDTLVCDLPLGRVPPRTLSLNFAVGGGVVGDATPAKTPKEVALAMVPEARQWVIAARDFVFDTRHGVRFPDQNIPRIPPRAAATDLHFKFRSMPAVMQEAFLTRLFTNYSQILDLLGDAANLFADDLAPRAANDPLLGAWAHAPIGGFFNPKQISKVFFRDIYAAVPGPRCRVAMIIHECAHSVAKARHFADDGPTKDGTRTKPDGVNLHPRNYAQLTAFEAVENACSYAAFSAHARFNDDVRPGAHNLNV